MKRISFVVMIVAFTAACSGANQTSHTKITDPSKKLEITEDNNSREVICDSNQEYRNCMRTNHDDGMCRMIAIQACSGGGMGMAFTAAALSANYMPRTASHNSDATHPAVLQGVPASPATLGTNKHLVTDDRFQALEESVDAIDGQTQYNAQRIEQQQGSGK